MSAAALWSRVSESVSSAGSTLFDIAVNAIKPQSQSQPQPEPASIERPTAQVPETPLITLDLVLQTLVAIVICYLVTRVMIKITSALMVTIIEVVKVSLASLVVIGYIEVIRNEQLRGQLLVMAQEAFQSLAYNVKMFPSTVGTYIWRWE